MITPGSLESRNGLEIGGAASPMKGKSLNRNVQREAAPRIGVPAISRGSSAAETPGIAGKKSRTPKRGASSAVTLDRVNRGIVLQTRLLRDAASQSALRETV